MSAAGGQADASSGTPPDAARTFARDVCLLAALAGWLVAVHVAHPDLADPDEARTALVARLMAERGDWLAPHLPAAFHRDYPGSPVEGDLIAYWDKPPLYFWLSAAAMRVVGPTALAARLPSALSHVAMVLLVYAAGRAAWGRRAGLLAGAVLATAPLAVALGSLARMDALLVALVTAMLVAVLRLLGDRPGSWAWAAVLWTAAGLGLLAKGPVAVVLPGAAVGVALTLTRRWAHVGRLRPLAGLGLMLAVAAPWYAYMHLRYPPAGAGETAGFTHAFFVSQHLARAATDQFGHGGRVPGYLAGVLLAMCLPWTIFLPAACVRLGREAWRARGRSAAATAVILLAAGAILTVLAFSLSRTQLPHYVAPAVPPLAVLIGAYLADRLAVAGPGRWFVVGLWLTAAGGVAALGAMVGSLAWAGAWSAAGVALAAAFAVALAGGIVALVRRRRVASVALLLAGVALAVTFVFVADPLGLFDMRTTRRECEVLAREARPADRIVAFPSVPYSAAWYLWPRPVSVPTVDDRPAGEPSLPALVRELNEPRRTFCLLGKRAALDALRREVRWPVRVLLEKRRHTLLVTEPPEAGAEPRPSAEEAGRGS